MPGFQSDSAENERKRRFGEGDAHRDAARSDGSPAPESELESGHAPTPDEILAETESQDPDVGVDGTGVGELP